MGSPALTFPLLSVQAPILKLDEPSPILSTLFRFLPVGLHRAQFIKADVVNTHEWATLTIEVGKMTQLKGLMDESEPARPLTTGISLREKTLKVLSTGGVK